MDAIFRDFLSSGDDDVRLVKWCDFFPSSITEFSKSCCIQLFFIESVKKKAKGWCLWTWKTFHGVFFLRFSPFPSGQVRKELPTVLRWALFLPLPTRAIRFEGDGTSNSQLIVFASHVNEIILRNLLPRFLLSELPSLYRRIVFLEFPASSCF